MRYKVREGFVFWKRRPTLDDKGKVVKIDEQRMDAGAIIDDTDPAWELSVNPTPDGKVGMQLHKLECLDPKPEDRESKERTTRPKIASETR